MAPLGFTSQELALKVVVTPHVVALVIDVGGHDHAHGITGKVVQVVPDHWRYVQRLMGAVQVPAHSLTTIVHHHVEAAVDGNDVLVQGIVRVPASCGAARNVVKVVDATNVERDVLTTFHECQVTTMVMDAGQRQRHAIGKCGHDCSLGKWGFRQCSREIGPVGAFRLLSVILP